MNNLTLAISLVASLTGMPATADTQLDFDGSIELQGIDGFDLEILFCANTAFTEGKIAEQDLADCKTVGEFAGLVTAAGYTVTDGEIAANAAADLADDNDIVVDYLHGAS